MDTIQNIIFAVAGIIYLIYSALNGAKKNKPNPPVAGETPVLPKEDIPSLEDLLREIGRKGGASKNDRKEKAKGPARPVPVAPQPATEQSRTDEPFTTAQQHSFERRPWYEKLEQADFSYEQEPSADELAPRLERVPRYVNEAEAVDYEDPKRVAYAGLDSRKPRFEPFEKEPRTVSRYARLLRNPQSAREAFILTEILRRKY